MPRRFSIFFSERATLSRTGSPGRGGRRGGGSKSFATSASSRSINPHVRRPDVRLCVHVEVAPLMRGRGRSLRLDVNGAAYARRRSSTITSPSAAEYASAAGIDIMHARLQRCAHTPMLPAIVPTKMRALVVRLRGVGGIIVCRLRPPFDGCRDGHGDLLRHSTCPSRTCRHARQHAAHRTSGTRQRTDGVVTHPAGQALPVRHRRKTAGRSISPPGPFFRPWSRI